MQHQPLLAAVDLGSNSFRLQVARVVDNQLYMLDSLREPVRLAMGLGEDKRLDKASQQRALACLHRFGERLRELPRDSVRAVGTNALRIAKNSPQFLKEAEAALGFPVEVVAGREEARLIYLGVAQGLPKSEEVRMVMDIGGGSTEFIIGCGMRPLKLESLYMGCVSYSERYFQGGKIGKANLKQAELAARNEVQAISAEFSAGHWDIAFGSSGTARVLCDILEQNGFSDSGITREGLELLRAQLLKAGDMSCFDLPGMKPDRTAVLLGGFAIMYGVFCELGIEIMQPAQGALREGVLYDLLGRSHKHDMREVTVQQFMHRYHVDLRQAERVSRLAGHLAQQMLGSHLEAEELRLLDWAACLHEIGISVAHSGYHKHSSYILANADMPGFSKKEQGRLSLLALSHRGSMEKLRDLLVTAELRVQAMSLRLAALFYRSRGDVALPEMRVHYSDSGFQLVIAPGWLACNPLTETALLEEMRQWKNFGTGMQVIEG